MIRKKICMLGAFSVGKTSLVMRFVKSMFSEQYHTTVGVKIDKKELTVGDQSISVLLWDLHGEDEFQKVRDSYLRGTSGYLLVVDGTRAATLETARQLQQRVVDTIGEVPFELLLNKSDLDDEWELDGAVLEELEQNGWTIRRTSAKSGDGVEEAFQSLASEMLSVR